MLKNIRSYKEVVIDNVLEQDDEIISNDLVNEFIDTFLISGRPYNEFPYYILFELNEGLMSRVIGGLTGLALGKAISRFLVKIFNLNDNSVLYKILTSKMFYMAIGASFGRETSGKNKKLTN